MKMTLVGGMSFFRSISLLTDTHQATARYSENGITTSLKPRPPLTQFINAHRLPLPQTIKLLLFTFDNLGWMGRVMMAGLLVLFTYSMFSLRDRAAPTTYSFSPNLDVETLGWMSVLVLQYAALALWVRYAIGRWHAAEHMAIAAYDRSGATDLASIRKESRIDERCGGRFLVPFLVASLVSSWLMVEYRWYPLIAVLLPLELVLWLDRIPGWRRQWFIRVPSELLQRYITTREPTDKELRTAQAALLRLTELRNV